MFSLNGAASPRQLPMRITTISRPASSGPSSGLARSSSGSGIEALATTEGALDDLRWHWMIAESGWQGRVITTYRPDSVVDPEVDGFCRQRRAAWRFDRRGHDDLGGLP